MSITTSKNKMSTSGISDNIMNKGTTKEAFEEGNKQNKSQDVKITMEKIITDEKEYNKLRPQHLTKNYKANNQREESHHENIKDSTMDSTKKIDHLILQETKNNIHEPKNNIRETNQETKKEKYISLSNNNIVTTNYSQHFQLKNHVGLIVTLT
jgi:hypothetical protein